MNLTSDAKQTVYLEDIPVGRLVDEGTDQVFYVPGDGGLRQRLLPLNGIRLPCKGKTRTLEASEPFVSFLKAKLRNRR